MKVPNPEIVAEVKGLSKEARGEVIHTLFNGLCAMRLQLELDLNKQVPRTETLAHVDKTTDEWFRLRFKELGFIEEV